MTECENLTQDDIYDDGVSITNKIAFGGLKTVFEAASGTGPKPKVPSKPGHKVPPCLSPKNNVDTDITSTMNGSAGVPVLPAKFTRDKTETSPVNNFKRSSKVNIPDIFANANSDNPPKTSPKPAVKPPATPLKPKPNTVPWSQRNKETDVKTNTEHSKEENTNSNAPNAQEKPPWSTRQRKASDNETSVQPSPRLTWTQRQALLKAENTADTVDKPLKSPNEILPKSPNIEKNDESHPQPQKKRPSVLDKYGIREKTINPVATSPKPVLSPRIDEKETPSEKNESHLNVQSSVKRLPANASPFGGVTNIESLKNKLKHVTPGNVTDTKSENTVNLRNKTDSALSGEKRKSIIRKSLTRNIDGLKFYVIEFNDVKSNNSRPPLKPPKLKEKVDLDKIIANYQASLVDIGIIYQNIVFKLNISEFCISHKNVKIETKARKSNIRCIKFQLKFLV
ncbi:hypothetical protein KUTeg_016044 [Tegillarca granosa]|uniref:Uncharacterized protein n=1 Tax=Tegillarca granosa TaxID=220873 RepID=A0ABQ9EJQ7_TEGGR|nr:hypothetical protein KUTeg_016044 [Tegillarca granosa]